MSISLLNRLKAKAGADKRRSERVDFVQSSYCVKPDGGGDTPSSYECWFKNISDHGVLFESKAKLQVGDTLRLLYRKGSQYCNDEVRIVYIRRIFDSFNYGCAFTGTDLAAGEQRGASAS